LTTCLQRLAADRETVSRFATNSARRIATEFSLVACAARMGEIYEQALHEAGALE
jgi:hypothetical protein